MVLRSCCKFGPVLVWFRLGYVVLLWLCVTHLRCARAETKTVVQKDAEFDVTYNDTVTSDNQTIYAFNHTVSRNKTEGVRVTVDVLSEGAESSPILFVVRQKQAVLSFQVPLILRGLYQRKYPYAHVGRTLCQPPTRSLTETQYFFVDVSTLSSLGTHYQLRISRVDSFTLHTDKKFSFTASPSQPQYFKYVFPDGVDTVIVKVNSEMTFPCSVMSIQDIQAHALLLRTTRMTETNGAFKTTENSGKIRGQIMTSVIFRSESRSSRLPRWNSELDDRSKRFFPSRSSPLLMRLQRKRLIFLITKPFLELHMYYGNPLPTEGLLRNAKINTCFSFLLQNRGVTKTQCKALSGVLSAHRGGGNLHSTHLMGPVAVATTLALATQVLRSGRHTHTHTYRHTCSSLIAKFCVLPYHQCPVYDLDNNVAFIGMYQTMTKTAAITVQKYLCVSDLARKDKRVLSKKYQIYFWNIATIGVFYALPVIQLVITYQTVVNVTGNQDICYYNFLCAHPLGNLSAFNNILSNLGYVMLGLLFLLIVLQRDVIHSRALDRNDLNALECGIPKHFGLFYAMGTALMMEGLLSACYHVCPNYTNFQFDTSFMYMIAGLCVLKLYQKRHPDINASAYTAYACLAAVIFFSVLGVVFGKGNMVFWIVFSVLHILATMLLSTQLYYMGRWRLDSGILRRIVYVIYTDCIRQCSGPMYIDRMVLLVMGNIVNWSLAAYGLLKTPNDFASYLLAIAICNLLLYFAFYIIMKLRSGERIQCMAMVCILFTAVVWGFALFFFFQGLSTWQKTPAESREHNRDCIVLSFFDDHDIWHFLSSIAMFGSFLVLLTMDDDLDNVQRDKIFVF
ncbi:unnamed protein product [Oncorhynchus mykiss]|uniref:SID1 transmembrane family member 2 n=1 Tax=Oncorhynchus mykiss TaxID=8022 RepID=A0A060VV49_ONCMY|nr:unnamed protein product [Oncorhynchus mykiss]